MKNNRKWLRYSLRIGVLLFMLMNVVALFHSYKFTHFASNGLSKTRNPKELGTVEKLQTLILGVSNPRPENLQKPLVAYKTVHLQSNKKIACWEIKTENALGTVILFHGFSGNKSSMLDKADIFRSLGYNTFLVDFMGSGGSEGNQTTIGFFEAEQVKTCYDYLVEKGESNLYLFGTSMGAVAIMKAMNDYQLNPKGIMIECPFGSMYKTVCARFDLMHVPTFPLAGLLVFWGGVQNGFWAFGFNPIEYAKNISCPTLLMYGQKDQKVSREEIDGIYQNLKGKKALKVYAEAAHESYLKAYKKEWTNDIAQFLHDKKP